MLNYIINENQKKAMGTVGTMDISLTFLKLLATSVAKIETV